MAETEAHEDRTEMRHNARLRCPEFRGVCSCGAASNWFKTSGIVSGWIATHQHPND